MVQLPGTYLQTAVGIGLTDMTVWMIQLPGDLSDESVFYRVVKCWGVHQLDLARLQPSLFPFLPTLRYSR